MTQFKSIFTQYWCRISEVFIFLILFENITLMLEKHFKIAYIQSATYFSPSLISKFIFIDIDLRH
jgi:hypothetical protein